MSKARVLLIGWDAADWKVIRPMLAAGQMPNLARFMSEGVHGNVATIYPVLSPMLWTSIATGKRAYKHGIHGFSEPLPDGSGVRPITLLSRKTKAVWNILNQSGYRSLVAGWWPSHPAEPLNGVMVSDHFPQPAGKPGAIPPLASGSVHPASLSASLGELRVNPMELSGEFIRLFVPEYERVDQSKDKRLHVLGKLIAETMSIHAVGTELLATQPWDFAAIYYNGIDHFEHGFMRFHPPRLPWVSEAEYSIYQHVVANAYRYHDAMLGTLLGLADESTTVILMSDHGFHPDHLRAAYIPAEPAGPAIEHRHFGILCMKGPSLRSNQEIFGASVLDICPTVLTLFGLPSGKDMDGKVLSSAFKEPPAVELIETWDNVPGSAGTHPPDSQLDPVASAEAFKQLVELGYVAPPGPNVQETVDECQAELKFNLARSYRDGNYCGEAAALAQDLWNRWPKDNRFGFLLIDCLAPLGQLARRREAIAELERRIEVNQAEAKAELARRDSEKAVPQNPGAVPSPMDRRRAFELNRLRELAFGRPLLMEWLHASQALLERQPAQARPHLQKLEDADASTPAMTQRIAAALAELGDLEQAHTLLQSALEQDPDNALVHAQLAVIHVKAERYDLAIAAATESLSLIYFQPGLHALVGQALLESGRFGEAEKELLVAVSQSPRNLVGHQLLARLYREHLDRPDLAYAHEGRALSLRNELAVRQRAEVSLSMGPADSVESDRDARRGTSPIACESSPQEPRAMFAEVLPAPFSDEVGSDKVILVVSGLPRSGTSMMMQLLVAAGRTALSDAKRLADPDNPLGYFEFEKTLQLAKDASWMPQARGKVVKVVAQLLPFLPRGEHYHVIFMERNLNEVIASQNTMLARQGRRGAELDPKTLLATYSTQLSRIRDQLDRRPEIRRVSINYGDLLSQPAVWVKHLAQFLGTPFNVDAALAAIRPELRRQRVTS